MTPREIQSLMRKLCYFGVSAAEGYRHLMRGDGLDRDLVSQLIDEYITTQDVIVYASSKDCSHVQKPAAFELIQDYRLNDAHARVQVVAADFSGRIVIEPIGVGVGERRKMQQ
jgi:hypothetical protein